MAHISTMNGFLKSTQTKTSTRAGHTNYELTDRDRSVSYERQIKDYVNEKKSSKRGIRKDAVLCDEWIITSDKDFFEKLGQEQTRKFLKRLKTTSRRITEKPTLLMPVYILMRVPHTCT